MVFVKKPNKCKQKSRGRGVMVRGRERENGRVRVCSRLPTYRSAAGKQCALGNVQSKKIHIKMEDFTVFYFYS